jgi:energy-converting hydrogenase Eha subunit C
VYRTGLSPLYRGLEIGLTHGYFLVGPFYKLGSLRNLDVALLSGYFSAVGLIIILVACLTIYGIVSFENNNVKDELQSFQGWQ